MIPKEITETDLINMSLNLEPTEPANACEWCGTEDREKIDFMGRYCEDCQLEINNLN